MLAQRIIVVGAGLSGLAVAHDLANAGATVTIVEARDRIGGRVWTVRDRLLDGAFGELGAEFIDDDHRRMRALARRLGVETVRTLPRGFTQRSRADDGHFTVSRTRAWGDLREAMKPLVRDYRGAEGAPASEPVRELATYSVGDWLRHRHAPPRVHATADAMRGFFLADADELSALQLASELAEGGAPSQTPVHRIVGGNDRLLEAMQERTAAQLLLGRRLRTVRRHDDRVVCTVTDHHGSHHTLEAEAAIITVPTTALRDVEITPALPEPQWHAIRSLRYGCATKAAVQLDGDLFGGPARAFATDSHMGAFWDAADGLPTQDFVVSFLAGGSASAQLAGQLQAGVDGLLSDLCWLGQGGRAPRPRAHVTWTWEQDPFARGGYAYIDPGFDSAWLPLLGQSAGRLFFAGEHTSEHFQGYMEGALESAERVVGELTRA